MAIDERCPSCGNANFLVARDGNSTRRCAACFCEWMSPPAPPPPAPPPAICSHCEKIIKMLEDKVKELEDDIKYKDLYNDKLLSAVQKAGYQVVVRSEGDK